MKADHAQRRLAIGHCKRVDRDTLCCEESFVEAIDWTALVTATQPKRPFFVICSFMSVTLERRLDGLCGPSHRGKVKIDRRDFSA